MKFRFLKICNKSFGKAEKKDGDHGCKWESNKTILKKKKKNEKMREKV